MEYTIATNRCGKYCVPNATSHRIAAKKVLSGKVYEPDTIQFLRRHCGTADIIHAGAFFGDFLPALARVCRPPAKIWAFEPNPESYECAQITRKLNGATNVELSQAALADQPGRLMLRTTTMMNGTPLGGGSWIVESATKPRKGCVEVPAVRIDDVVPDSRDVRIIHLDVEEFEDQALTGAMGTIERCRPILVLETDKKVVPWLDDIGYEPVKQVHSNTVYFPAR